jgi:hypothetical protein
MEEVPPIPGEDLSAGRDAALARVKNPAMWLMISTIAAAVFAVFGLLAGLLDVFNVRQYSADMGILGSTAFNTIQTVVDLVVAVVIYLAALRMQRLESWGLAFAGAILAMLPCVSPCCVLTLPFGIWALVVLLNDEVKRHFR